MMIIVNVVGDFITGSVNGKPFGVSFDQKKYEEMLALQTRAAQAKDLAELQSIVDDFEPLTMENYKEIVEYKSTQFIYVNKHTNRFYLKYGDKISKESLPQAFVDRIVKSVEKNIDIKPLIKCWARFMRPVPGRPAYSTERAKLFAAYIDADYVNEGHIDELMKSAGVAQSIARAMATTKQVAITQEGLLVCYKVSREIRHRFELNDDEEVVQKSRYTKQVDPDTGLVTYKEPEFMEERLFEPWIMGQGGDAFYCGEKPGHFIRVGQLHFLDSWDKVSSPGHKGLHCGGLRYIQGFQQEGSVTHNIFVDPMDIHTIAGLGTGSDGAMTVRRYFVHSSFAGPNKNIYHSSSYAELTDAEYAKLVQEAVEATEAKKGELAAILDQAKALGGDIDGSATVAGDVLNA